MQTITSSTQGKNARKKLAHRQRTERYFESVFGTLNAGQDETQMRRAEAEVQRRIERNMNHGFDWHPDGGKIVVNFHGAMRHLSSRRSAAKQNDSRALQYLTERALPLRA